METDICIIGAGPAGMMAAVSADSKNVIIIESNTTLGRKLLLTGRQRCNLTHTGSPNEFIRKYKPFDKFVRHCIYELPPDKLRDFFAQRGLETFAESNGCVFPKTNKASDVKQILVDELKKSNIKILYGKKVLSVKYLAHGFTGGSAAECKNGSFIIDCDKFKISAKSLIIATGGLSWPQTGSTGDGYKFAQSLGHNIIEPKACLVPLVTKENFSSLAGIGIQNVEISCTIDGRKISSSGPLMFTHNGIGGPAGFDFSRNIADRLYKSNKDLNISIDLLPDIKSDELDRTLAQSFSKNSGQAVLSILAKLLPKALAQIICAEIGLSATRAGEANKNIRKNLIAKLKLFPLSITAAASIERATITRGGIDTAQIDPKTMQSKLCEGLFFAGEVLNVDGPCGGYNLQFAFSSGFLAGKSAVIYCH